MTGLRPNRWLLLFLLLAIASGRWLPAHSHLGAAHDHDGAHHHHRAEIHAHQAMAHADAIDVGHAASHELGQIDLQQDQLARLAAPADDLPDAAPPAPRLAAAQQAAARVFRATTEPPPASRPPPHRGEARAPPHTA